VLKRILFSIILSIFTCCSIATVNAQGISYRLDKSKVRALLAPGGSQSGAIKAYSQTNETLKFKVYFEDWIYEKIQDGSKEFMPANTSAFSCANWIKFNPAEFTLTPYGVQTINYVITVPDDAKGSHVGVMFFETNTADSSGFEVGKSQETLKSGVGLDIRIGSLFYVDAKGAINRSAEISKFSVTKDSKNKYFIISADFKNTGDADITTESTYHITDKQGMIYARGKFNPVYTLPGDAAEISSTWKDSIPAGVYNIVLTINLGKAIEEAGIGRGPIMLKETVLEINQNGEVTKIGSLK
jgi:hypothetical protein